MSIYDDPFGECCDEETLAIFCGPVDSDGE